MNIYNFLGTTHSIAWTHLKGNLKSIFSHRQKLISFRSEIVGFYTVWKRSKENVPKYQDVMFKLYQCFTKCVMKTKSVCTKN